MKRLTKEIENMQKDMSNSDMRIDLKESYYNLMKPNDVNHSIFEPEKHDMFTLDIHKNYYTGDEESVLHDLIEDLEDRTDRLKQLYKEMFGEKYINFSKVKRDDWER